MQRAILFLRLFSARRADSFVHSGARAIRLDTALDLAVAMVLAFGMVLASGCAAGPDEGAEGEGLDVTQDVNQVLDSGTSSGGGDDVGSSGASSGGTSSGGASSGGTSSGGDDTAVGGDDTNPPVDCPGGPGCSCKQNAECDTALCIDTPAGKQCARFCVEDCPKGFKCSPVASGGGDTATVCVPEFGLVCNPCTASKECIALGQKDPACVDLGSQGSFCGIGCDTSAGCPTGYACEDVTSVEGGKSKQCIREQGKDGKPQDCPCSAAAKTKKLTTNCTVEVKENGKVIGTCAGLRKCTKDGLSKCIAPPAQAEVCDGQDNDCDSQIDEGTCDDTNPCTTDLCDPAKTTDQKEGCSHIVANAPCNADNNVCTENDQCVDGICNPGKLKNCEDGNPCTKESCDMAKGCSSTVDDGAPCDDENPCTVGDKCQAGKCGSGGAKGCTSTESCIEAKCNLVTGKCKYQVKQAGLPCDDGTACTKEDACVDGVCKGKVKSCDDKNACTDDSCSPQKGCLYKDNTAPCNDDDACTLTDLCAGGACKGKALDPKVTCKDGNVCTDDTCDKKLGCRNPNNGAKCDDGNPCTEGDLCQSGTCQAGSNKCECFGDKDCAKKEDGDLCNGTLVCDKSSKPFKCNIDPKTVVSCPAGKGGACLANTCNKSKGSCVLLPKNEGQPCDADGSICTKGDKCDGGVCKPGKPVDCNDQNACTIDSCHPTKGCQQTAAKGPCDDGQGCTVKDTCKDKLCIAGPTRKCDDGDVCTQDFCDKGSGKCNVKPIGGCGGFCAKDTDCEDKNECTSTACVQGKCLVKYLSKTCDDGSKCTDADACGSGKCSGKTLDCNDGNPCTKDACNPSVGCVKTVLTGKCDDGNACTSGDTCQAAKCVAGIEKKCNDGDDCTKDACDANTGKCGASPIVGCGGYCKVHKDCDDGSVCTTGVCGSNSNDKNGPGKCVITFNSGKCDDGNPCTAFDVCVKGKCGFGKGVQVTTFAGGGVAGYQDAPAKQALFSAPGQIAFGKAGELYVADTGNHRVRRIGTNGSVSTVGGNGKPGLKDGAGPLVQFNAPRGVSQDGKGHIFVADTGNNAIRRITGSLIITVAGNGTAGSVDGKGSAARFKGPYAVAATPGGNVYVADTGNHRVRRVSATGVVTTIAGSVQGFINGFAKGVRFNAPTGIALDSHGNLVVADRDNHRIRKVTPSGITTTLAGTSAGYSDDAALKAQFNKPWAVAADLVGGIWVADSANHRLRHIAGGAAGKVTTVAGSVKGYADGPGNKARFQHLTGVAIDRFGTVLLADDKNQRIRAVRNHDGNCKIDSGCWAQGTVNPKNTCQTCQGGKKATAWTSLGQGDSCSDGKACSIGDACDSKGACKAGKESCDDGNKCTKDSCDAAGDCVHVAIAGCGGFCKFSVDCDDNNPCTDEQCIGGQCGFTFNDQPCKSGSGCTLGDKCVLGKCVKGAEVGVSTVAGSGYKGFGNGAGPQAKFSGLRGVAVSDKGVVYVADEDNRRIRVVAANGTVATYAGTGSAGSTDGKRLSARFARPSDVALTANGTMYVVDSQYHTVRRIKADIVSHLAGSPGSQGSQDGSGSTARFRAPGGVTVSADGGAIVADTGNHRIRRVSASGSVATLAGGSQGYLDGAGASARFNQPWAVAQGSNGNIYIADTGNHRIRLLTPKGQVLTVAGSGKPGHNDEAGKLAQFNAPSGLGIDGAGNVYIADTANNRVRKMLPNGLVLTASGGAKGYKDGTGSKALFNGPRGIAVDIFGRVFLADAGNYRLRKVRDSKDSCQIGGACWAAAIVNPANACQRCDASVKDNNWSASLAGAGCDDGDLCTVKDVCNKTGACAGAKKSCDDSNKCTLDACEPGSGQCVSKPIIGCGGFCKVGVDCDDGNACTDDACVSGKCKALFNTKPCKASSPCSVQDTCTLGKCVAGTGVVVSTYAGSGYGGFADGSAGTSKFLRPRGVSSDALGNVYVADWDNSRVRKILPNGNVTTFAGTTKGFADGLGKAARLNRPTALDVDAAGNVYVMDFANHAVRKIRKDGVVSTLAGSGSPGYTDSCGKSARFAYPEGITTTPGGLVFVGETGGHRIRRVSPSGCTSTIAGSSAGFADGKGSQVKFYNPRGLAVAGDGAIVVADSSNHVIRRVQVDGSVTTLAGTPRKAGRIDGVASKSYFNNPYDVGLDGAGNIYIVEDGNHDVRRLSPTGVVTTFAGTGKTGVKDGLATSALFANPRGLHVDVFGAVYIAEYSNHRIRRIWNGGNTCFIGGKCYAHKQRKPDNFCAYCLANKDATKWTLLPSGTACNDGQACTSADSCSAKGQCAGKTVDCNDNDKCTKDACNLATGKCTNTAIIGCDGNCAKDSDCEDKNPCTNTSCEFGKCKKIFNSNPCKSGKPCSLGDRCDKGTCTAKFARVVSTWAGNGFKGTVNGPKENAQFYEPGSVAWLSNGDALIVDRYNNRIRRVDSKGVVSTWSGSSYDYVEGDKAKARYRYPIDILATGDDTVFVLDQNNHCIRKVSPFGVVSQYAGRCRYAGNNDGGRGSGRMSSPYGMTRSDDGVIYVADYGNHRIRRVSTSGYMTTLAGSGSTGGTNGTGSSARFYHPIDITLGPTGDLFVADYRNHRIRRVTVKGVVTTYTGSSAGYTDGNLLKARFSYPHAIATAPDGTLLVADHGNRRVRKITSTEVTTWAGGGSAGKDGDALKSGFASLYRLTIGPRGGVYVGEGSAQRVRKVVDSKDNCLIGGACYADGVYDPNNRCKRCLATKSQTAWAPMAKGGLCTDGKPCTVNDQCDGSGSCTGTVNTCDDKDKCTKDSCDPKTGKCTNTPTIGCGGYCTSLTHCKDANACTDEQCINGKCKVTFNSQPCSAGDACSKGDKCTSGVCKSFGYNWVSTYVGSGFQGSANGQKATASFYDLRDVVKNSKGELFMADYHNNQIRKLDVKGNVSTFAGSSYDYVNGVGTKAKFRYPRDLAIDPSDNLYVADYNNHCIRKITPTGNVTQYAGRCRYSGTNDGWPGSARMSGPSGIARAHDGVIWVADYNNHKIRRVATNGYTTTFTGNGAGTTDGAGAQAKFYYPIDIAIDRDGNLIVLDYYSSRIRKVTMSGVVTTIAGSSRGHLDGPALKARFNYPQGLMIHPDGRIFIADSGNRRIRVLTTLGEVQTYAGSGGGGSNDGPVATATFDTPRGMFIDRDGSLLVTTRFKVRRIKPSANNCQIGGTCYVDGATKPDNQCEQCNYAKNKKGWTLAKAGLLCDDGNACTKSDTCSAKGNCFGTPVVCDDKDKCTKDSCDANTGKCKFVGIVGCNGYCNKHSECVDKNLCTDDLCESNKCVNKANSKSCKADGAPCSLGDHCKAGKCVAAGLSSMKTLVGLGFSGFADGDKELAKFNDPCGVVRRKDGTVFVTDRDNHRIRRISGAGIVTTISGQKGGGYANGKIADARWTGPWGIVMDASSNIYVSEASANRIRKIDAKGNVTLVAGGTAGFKDGTGSAARLYNPRGLAVREDGLLYVADYHNQRIRQVTPAGKVTTFAGSGSYSHSNGNGPQAMFRNPADVEVYTLGSLLVADYNNHRIRHITAQGKVSDFAGNGSNSLKDGPAASASIRYPGSVHADPQGDVWVASINYPTIRRIRNGIVTTVAGAGTNGDIDGYGSKSRFNEPWGMTMTPDGTLLIAAAGNHKIRTLKVSASNCKIGGLCWNDGFFNPTSSCQKCDFAKKPTDWTTTAKGGSCSDGDPCTEPDKCDGSGKCVAGAKKSCDDKDSCTVDSCQVLTGKCVHKAIAGCF